MLVHPTLTPVLSEDGHQLTLEEIFHDLFYRLELHVNHTYQMVNIGHAPSLLGNPIPSQADWAAFSKSNTLYKIALPEKYTCGLLECQESHEPRPPSLSSHTQQPAQGSDKPYRAKASIL